MVGASIALGLAQLEFEVALIEMNPPVRWESDSEMDLRVSAINRASENLFRHLGVWTDIVCRRASPYHGMIVWDAKSTGEIGFDAKESGEPNLGHIVENRVIQQTLWEYLSSRKEITLITGDRVLGLDLGKECAVVQLESGQTLEAKLLIGSDGARSAVRTMADINRSIRDYGQTAVVAHVETELSHQHTAWQRFLPTGPLAFLPLADGRSSIVWSTGSEQAQELLSLDDVSFRQALGRAFDLRLGCIRSVSSRRAFPLVGGQSYPYVKHRLALIGDAAHSIHPLAGQGVNLGLRDVAALLDILDRNRTDPGQFLALRAYERGRRFDNESMMRAMEALRWVFGVNLPLWPLARGWGMRLTDRLTPVKGLLMHHALGFSGEYQSWLQPPLDPLH